ncbi:MAG: hypothetical protein QM737_01100 [Ferruginibacter sp.]
MLKLFFVFFLSSIKLQAVQCQVKDTGSWHHRSFYKKDFSLLVGYSQGKYSFADIGFAINKYGANRHPFTGTYFISNEIKIGKNTIIGPKTGIWVGGGVGMGLNFIYYTDFHKSSFVFRPEYGIAIEKVKFVYGYNWNWTKSLHGISKHLVGLTYCFTLKRLKFVDERQGKK